jgi:ABC-type glutathione transport system ATPase component
MDEPLLVAENLNKSYFRSGGAFYLRSAARPALIDASLRVNRAEIIGVVGESGSGKTTLARCIALLDRPDTGRVIFKGEDLTKLSGSKLRARRRYIQTIFQDPYASLNPRMRVGNALAEVIRFHRLAAGEGVAARVRELLSKVGLPASAASAYPAAFSGGQRQRICIARALAAEPEILIADEPVSSLDVSIQAQVVNLLLDLKEQLGLSVIFIGHDLQLVNFIAPRVVIMLGGRIVETIPENKSLADAQHAYTRELLNAVPRLEEFGQVGTERRP